MSNTSWRGDDQRKLSAGGLRWFREKVRHDLNHDALGRGAELPSATIETLAEPFLVDPDYWLTWVPDTSYQPGSYLAPGQWVERKRYAPAIKAAIDTLMPAIEEQKRRASLVPKVGNGATVPPADVEAALAELAAAPAQEVREPMGFFLLETSQQMAFLQTQDRVRLRLKHACSCCGAYFSGKILKDDRPDRNRLADPVCPECEAAKRRRCTTCAEVFAVESPRVRRCPSCRPGTAHDATANRRRHGAS